MTVTIVTPTLPERAHLLAELRADIDAQTVPPAAWFAAADHERRGPAVLRNELVARATTTWVAFVDDDDRIDPEHLAALLAHAEDADVVYSDWRTEGRDGFGPDPCEDYAQLAARNWIPVTALVRRETFLAVGGFPTTMQHEDHGLWQRVWRAGGRFRRVPRVTWTYRFGAWGHRSFGGCGR